MALLLLAYIGGVLTIFSPCVLPVIPFVFSNSDKPFYKSGLPILIGMGISFSIFGALSATGGQWISQANEYGRIIALIVFTILGITLLFPSIAEKLTRPLVQLGNSLQKKTEGKSGFGTSLLIGASVGLLWAPCAGPILGLVLAGAAIGSSSGKTFILLMVFAMGAATSLGVAIFAGGKVLRILKKGLGAEEFIKRGLGVVVLLAVIMIGLGYDTEFLSRFSYLNTNKIEQQLVNQITPQNPISLQQVSKTTLADEGEMPSIIGAVSWLNSEPLTNESLKGKVVLVDFWTYSCINCLRTLPYVKNWATKYKDQGLVVIGVHTPEFAFEKNQDNVKKSLTKLKVEYPVALDNNYTIWNAFKNQYWPAHYFIDMNGRIRHHHFGEGNYEESEKVIQELLKEIPTNTKVIATHPNLDSSVQGQGIEAPTVNEQIESPETYLGYDRQVGFHSSPKIQKNKFQFYTSPKTISLNQWSLDGTWKIENENITLGSKQGKLSYQFRANDVHLVLGKANKKPVKFQVLIDGKPPGENHGLDTDENGFGIVTEHRLYQLVRQKQNTTNRLFTITFFNSDIQAFAFTFG